MPTNRVVQDEFFKLEITEGLPKEEYKKPTDAEKARELFACLKAWEARALKELKEFGDVCINWRSLAFNNDYRPGNYWDAPVVARSAFDILEKIRALQIATTRAYGFQIRLSQAEPEMRAQMLREVWDGIPKEGESFSMQQTGCMPLTAGGDLLSLISEAIELGMAVTRAHVAPHQETTKYGREFRETQRKRRKNKPGNNDSHDSGTDRNERIKRFHSKLKKAGDSDPVSKTATEFNLSARQVSRIVTPPRRKT